MEMLASPQTKAPLIDVRAVDKRFGRKRVLRGVDLSVAAGEVIALLGPNGAGKSTLMRIVAGLAKPTRGTVTLGGASWRGAGQELRRYIGVVAHQPLLYDGLSGWENLRFFARLYDLEEPEARMEGLLHAVNLWRRRHDLVRTYSRGMMQRLAIARALLHNPPVLLLDEPDTGLDQESTSMLQALIGELSAGKRAILYSTHNLDGAALWADAVCVLANGRIGVRVPATSLSGADVRALYTRALEDAAAL